MTNQSELQAYYEPFRTDFIKYTNLLTISTKEGIKAPFRLKPIQREFVKNMSGRDIVLKARQMGFSTVIQAYHYWAVTNNIGRNAFTLAHDRPSTKQLRRKFQDFWSDMPPALRPQMTKNDKDTTEFGELGSSNFIGTAGNDSVGRGYTLHHIHGSEFAFWPDPETIFSGLVQAVPLQNEMQASSIIFESTPNGAEGTFYDMCMAALNGDPTWKLHVYPWWKDPTYQIPLHPKEKLKYTKEEKELIELHGLKPEQIKFRRAKISEFRSFGKEQLFFQEYIEDAYSCFLSGGNSRFDATELNRRLRTQVQEPVATIGSYFDAKQKNHLPVVKIYKEPEEGRFYVIGADTSGGVGQDYASAIVRDWETNEQVATLRAQIEPIEQARMLIKLGHMYNLAFMGVERNNTGLTVLEYLTRGYYEPSDPDGAFDAYQNLYFDEVKKYFGWYTSVANRGVIINYLAVEYADSDIYVIRDPMIIREALNFTVQDVKKNIARAKSGKTDDLTMADAIAGAMKRIYQPLSLPMMHSPDRSEHDYVL